MKFDAKPLLTAPLVDLTIHGLAAALSQLQAAGMGGRREAAQRRAGPQD